jgi:hypothetical protein
MDEHGIQAELDAMEKQEKEKADKLLVQLGQTMLAKNDGDSKEETAMDLVEEEVDRYLGVEDDQDVV